MIKFNVGDRVKLIKVDVDDISADLKVGMIGTVEEPFYNLSTVEFDNWHGGLGKNNSRWHLLNLQLEKLKEMVK